jgi:hypothetical protein
MLGNMVNDIVDEVKYLVMEWHKYMDTTVPEGIDRQMFTHLKYDNQHRIKRFIKQYPDMDIGLLEKHALHEYLKKTDEEILKDMSIYYEEAIVYENIKGNGRSS